jgi:hypothetical protein
MSTGTKGFRYSVGPKGAYINIGAGGIYYRKKIGGNRTVQSSPRSRFQEPIQEQLYQGEQEEFATVNASELVDASSQEIIDQINQNMRQAARAPFVRWGAVIAACLVAQMPVSWHWIAGLIILIPGLIYAASIDGEDRNARTTPLFYELEAKSESDFQRIQKAFSSLAGAKRISLIQGMHHVSDWKRNAGASAELSTLPASVSANDHPPFIATNLTVPSLTTNTQRLFFFPDRILILQGKAYGAVAYQALSVDYTTKSFIESRTIPADAEVIGTTWEKVNRDGSRDKRFAQNRQFPILLYGYLGLHSDNGLNISLQVSNTKLGALFSETFSPPPQPASSSSYRSADFDVGGAQKKQRSRRSSGKSASTEKSDTGSESPYQILGLDEDAARDDITEAYRRLAKMYHPDRVSGLGPEFKEIAECKMKRINAAYEALEKKFS